MAQHLKRTLAALKDNKLLGTYFIPADFQPTVSLHLAYNRYGESVDLGNKLKVSDTQDPPAITISDDSKGAFSRPYTLVCMDPDAPSESDPKWSPFRHWVQGALSPAAGKQGLEKSDVRVELVPDSSSNGRPLTKYMGPGPPPSTSYHRYVFLLYRESTSLLAPSQQSTIKTDESGEQVRPQWDIATFVKENNLDLVGANFFRAQNPKQ